MKKKLTIMALVALVAGFMALGGGVAQAKGGCDVIVTSGDGATAIQDAVDNASSGDKICLSETFTTTSGPGGTSEVATVTIGTSNITVKSASPGILDGGSGPAFRLADGVTNVTIEGLEIKNRTGLRGGGIEAWDRSTSNITVRNNYIHDNTYSGVLVGSEGGFIHSNWHVRDNTVNNHGFLGIELTNCENCNIMKNNVGVGGGLTSAGFAGIIVQARNTIVDGSVAINGVAVLHNTVADANLFGMYVIAYEGLTGGPFSSVGGSSTLTNTTINNNTITGSGLEGIRLWAYNDGSGGSGGGSGGTADNATINHNYITCGPGMTGVRVHEAGVPGGIVNNVKVKNNTFTSCTTDISDTTVNGTGVK